MAGKVNVVAVDAGLQAGDRGGDGAKHRAVRVIQPLAARRSLARRGGMADGFGGGRILRRLGDLPARHAQPVEVELVVAVAGGVEAVDGVGARSEEHTSELQSLMRISYAVFCLKKKK